MSFSSHHLNLAPSAALRSLGFGLLRVAHASNLVTSRLSFSTRIFALSNKADFLEYLDDLETADSSEHLKAAREVYGDYYTTPDALLGSESRVLGLPPGSIPEGDEE